MTATAEMGAAPIEGQVLRSMAAEVPGELAASLDRAIARQGNIVAHVARERHAQGLRGTIGETRRAVRVLRHAEARRAYLALLAAGGDDPGGFVPPESDRDGEAMEVLAGILSKGPDGFPDLAKLFESSVPAWEAEAGRLRGPAAGDSPLSAEAVEWLRSDPGHPVEFLEDRLRKLARAGELSARAEALGAARGRLDLALRRRAAEAVKAAGGSAALADAAREASRMAAAAADPAGGLAAELAGVDRQLEQLGVDPADGESGGGRLAGSLLEARAGIVARMGALRAGARDGERAGASALVDRALAADPSAWSEVLKLALAVPGSFPEGFAAAWGEVPLAALAEAGPSDFVEPFEAD